MIEAVPRIGYRISVALELRGTSQKARHAFTFLPRGYRSEPPAMATGADAG